MLRARPGEAEAVEGTAALMERQVRHLTRIVDDLLEVARLSRGRTALRRERLDLARLVRQSVEDRRGLLESAGLTLEVTVPGTPVWVQADPTRMNQVLGNLLDNAHKFTPSGGSVAVKLSAEADEAVLRISDTGIGIGPEMLPRVFEVFSQADRSLDRDRGGLGLGLSVARGLMEMHGGTIEAESEGIGRGATFTLRLPTVPEPAALGSQPFPAPGRGGSGLRVLVVEDNRDAAESLRMLLEVCGHEVSLAHSGPEGVTAARAIRPHVVLCDIGLPGMDGFAVAARLRKSAETSGARLIAVTGYGEEEDRRRAREAGFDAHLVKPVEPQLLLEHLTAQTAH